MQYNYYYTCEVEGRVGEQSLDDGEKEAGFALKFAPIDEAIVANSAFRGSSMKQRMVEREKGERSFPRTVLQKNL
ncbi:MAG: hypothetical protein K6G36_03095 [Candidatus Saccharibacteria bacterium]|nr:hypothetical protein [Candidatus Saccharibacteria bacterium]